MPGFPSFQDLPCLLKLLDDDTPAVRESVAAAFSDFDGDISEALGVIDPPLPAADLSLLSELLRPSRRRRLRREWLVPAGGLSALHDDWDHSESLLRAVSDFLHDGVTLRQPLADAIDLLAEETESAYLGGGTRAWLRRLFQPTALRNAPASACSPAHYDLAAVASGLPSNAVGCGLVALLVARRLDAPLSAINLPDGFFLVDDGEAGGTIHDPGNGGRVVQRDAFLLHLRQYPREVRLRSGRPASPGELVLRLIDELATVFAVLGEDQDASLIEELIESLERPG